MAFKLRLPALRELFATASETVRRFPMPMAAALVATLVLLANIHDFAPLDRWVDAAWLFTLAFLAFFLFLAITLVGENRGFSKLITLILGGIGLAALVVLTYGQPADRLASLRGPVLFLGPCVVLLASAAPFLRRGDNNVAYWDFNRASWLSALLGFAAVIVLCAGVSSALYAIEALFSVNIPGEVFSDLWSLSLAFLWPLLALGGMPRSFQATACEVPWGLRLLAGRILVPLIAVYLAILYVYLAKIAIYWELPKGLVATLISIYATLGVVTYLLIYPLREQGDALIGLYNRFYFPALLPLLVLLGVALERRIADYGITEARYAVGLFGLWLALSALTFTLRPKARLKLLPISLASLLAVASFGPWGAVDLSTRSQLGQLESLLTRNALMKDGTIEAASAPIDFEDTKRISSIVSYFDETGKVAKLRAWTEAHGFSLKDYYTPVQIVGAFGLEFLSEWQDKTSFNLYWRIPNSLETTGFDYWASIDLPLLNSKQIPEAGADPAYRLEYQMIPERLVVTARDGAVLDFDLRPRIKRLRKLPSGTDLSKDMILEASAGRHHARLILENVTGQIDDGKPDVNHGRGFLLIGESAPAE